MSESVDLANFENLPEEARWNILRQVDLTTVARAGRLNTSFRDTVSTIFQNRIDIMQSAVEREVQQNQATAMDLQARFNDLFGDWQWTRPFWELSVMSQDKAIMENIETRLRRREYGEPDKEQLWSAIQDMDLLSPERALDWLKKFEEPDPQERVRLINVAQQQPDREGVWSIAPSVRYGEFVSAAREMWMRREDFFVSGDEPIDDQFYNVWLRNEGTTPGFILRSWASGTIRIRSYEYPPIRG
jgi:hypothetical protein